MYKLLIVEDESKTRSALTSCMDWNEMGITAVIEASNGKKALELAKRDNIDLMITDIRMPEMDGLELSMCLKEMNSDIQIIIISAYSELNYLKTAIKHHAVDYILKPIDVQELKNAVQIGIERRMTASRRQKESFVLQQNLFLLREQFFKSLVTGQRKPDDMLAEILAAYHWESLQHYHFGMFVIHFMDKAENHSLLFKQTLLSQIKSIALHRTKLCKFSLAFQIRDNEMIVVMGDADSRINVDLVRDAAVSACASIEENCHIQARASVCPYTVPLAEFYKSYHEVKSLESHDTAGNPGIKSGLSQRDSLLILRIKQYIEKHYWNENMTINDIAAEMCYTSAYVCMVFKKETGITLNHYINMFRINKSKELLTDVTLRTADVAEIVGYSSENYFSKVFKKYEGISPFDFKKGGS